MYSAPYGYPSAAAGGPNFNGAPTSQNASHMQPGPSQGQHQHQHQPPQHQPPQHQPPQHQPPQHQQHQQHQQMMYNPQQFPMGAQGAAFAGAPAMMGAGGPAGVMQNAAMPHMPANSQMAYQTPYTSSPYGANVPSSAAPQPQMPSNYMMAGQMAQYPMNTGGMPAQQQMMQRMHPTQQNASAMSPQRPFNPQGTPTSMSTPQFPGPQGQGPPPSNAQPPASVTTPQTPTFPPTGQPAQMNGTAGVSTPLSPGSESRDKERFELILEINKELMYDSLMLHNTRAELRKEAAADEAGGKEHEANDQEKAVALDYSQCMRRLQGNLAYLASLADRKSTPQPHPAILSAPSLHVNIKIKGVPVYSEDANGGPQAVDMNDREERDKYLKELYRRLQACFPGVDPAKEYPLPVTGQRQTQGQQSQGGAKVQQNGQNPAGGSGSNHSSPAPGGHLQKTPQMVNAAPPSMPGQSTGV